MAALDVATLSSKSEAFPGVVGEAMACAVPCVVTDVGDSRELVGETGVIVPAEDPVRLAEGWRRVLSLRDAERAAWGERARARIVENFSLERMVGEYQGLYRSLLASDDRGEEVV